MARQRRCSRKQREYRMNPELLRTFTVLKLSEDVGEINPFAPPPKDDNTVCFSLQYFLPIFLYSLISGATNCKGETQEQKTVYSKEGKEEAKERARD